MKLTNLRTLSVVLCVAAWAAAGDRSVAAEAHAVAELRSEWRELAQRMSMDWSLGAESLNADKLTTTSDEFSSLAGNSWDSDPLLGSTGRRFLATASKLFTGMKTKAAAADTTDQRADVLRAGNVDLEAIKCTSYRAMLPVAKKLAGPPTNSQIGLNAKAIGRKIELVNTTETTLTDVTLQIVVTTAADESYEHFYFVPKWSPKETLKLPGATAWQAGVDSAVAMNVTSLSAEAELTAAVKLDAFYELAIQEEVATAKGQFEESPEPMFKRCDAVLKKMGPLVAAASLAELKILRNAGMRYSIDLKGWQRSIKANEDAKKANETLIKRYRENSSVNNAKSVEGNWRQIEELKKKNQKLDFERRALQENKPKPEKYLPAKYSL